MLGPQSFSGNPLCRLSELPARFRAATNPHAEVSLVVVAGRDVVVRLPPPASPHSPGQQDLQALLLRRDDAELRLEAEQLTLEWVAAEGTAAVSLPLYLLGQDVSGRWTFALDVSAARDAFLSFLQGACELDVALRDVRTLLPALSLDAAAIAGQAVALAGWHQTHGFCARCGQPTLPIEAGTRRRCPAGHRSVPRSEPVVVTLVESPDGSRALLGRTAKSTPGMYTCLSGFVEPCEGVEEAVRREVMEEARITVGEVVVLGTQPWPIGRYGSCELMLGCVAKASSYEVLLSGARELEDAQWYDRDELAAAVAAYDGAAHLQEAQKRSWARYGFFLPPPFTLAHHLIRAWALCGSGPMFAAPEPPSTEVHGTNGTNGTNGTLDTNGKDASHKTTPVNGVQSAAVM